MRGLQVEERTLARLRTLTLTKALEGSRVAMDAGSSGVIQSPVTRAMLGLSDGLQAVIMLSLMVTSERHLLDAYDEAGHGETIARYSSIAPPPPVERELMALLDDIETTFLPRWEEELSSHARGFMLLGRLREELASARELFRGLTPAHEAMQSIVSAFHSAGSVKLLSLRGRLALFSPLFPERDAFFRTKSPLHLQNFVAMMSALLEAPYMRDDYFVSMPEGSTEKLPGSGEPERYLRVIQAKLALLETHALLQEAGAL